MESVQLVFDYFCERTPRCAQSLCACDLWGLLTAMESMQAPPMYTF